MVMSKKNLPALQDSGTLAAGDDEFHRRLADMRRDAARDEERVICFVCARSGRTFHARFTRVSAAHRFQLAAIEKDEPAPAARGGLFGSWRKPVAPEPKVFNISEFDFGGWHCPWCDAEGKFIRCAKCSGLVCRGRTRKAANGEELFACHDGCGSTGVTGPRLESVAGSRRNGEPAGLPKEERLALPAAAKRLPPPKK
jgi:hypothetical protein